MKCPTKHVKDIFFCFSRFENWAFQNLTRDEISNKKERETESVRFLGISKFYAYEIMRKIHLSHAFWGISNYLPYTVKSPIIG